MDEGFAGGEVTCKADMAQKLGSDCIEFTTHQEQLPTTTTGGGGPEATCNSDPTTPPWIMTDTYTDALTIKAGICSTDLVSE